MPEILDWSGADDVPVIPANTFLMQGVGDEVILLFGHAPPPVATAYMDEAAKTAYFSDGHRVRVTQIVRLSVTTDVAKSISKVFEMNVGGGEK